MQESQEVDAKSSLLHAHSTPQDIQSHNNVVNVQHLSEAIVVIIRNMLLTLHYRSNSSTDK
ncbi:hypothetical protein T12_6814 [Trichinella patagoniensis]|uniref:Uncharacterized protein n=1 Tax=Trichinella patagoniensis TaxID=990121 RepID=A0A0V0ZRT3_9BILA|nr:hypothetical protein T12_6814 [Trichinella patagoniensis]